jgi:phosphoribosyl-AMP cyclohydrolase
MTLDPAIAARLKRNADGLFTAIVQERSSGDVLMVAWMDDEALARTLQTREGTYFSRSRGEQWVKGATSGHTQRVHSVRLDCDGDAVRATRATTAASTPIWSWVQTNDTRRNPRRRRLHASFS